jgi:hypothetical protein
MSSHLPRRKTLATHTQYPDRHPGSATMHAAMRFEVKALGPFVLRDWTLTAHRSCIAKVWFISSPHRVRKKCLRVRASGLLPQKVVSLRDPVSPPPYDPSAVLSRCSQRASRSLRVSESLQTSVAAQAVDLQAVRAARSRNSCSSCSRMRSARTGDLPAVRCADADGCRRTESGCRCLKAKRRSVQAPVCLSTSQERRRTSNRSGKASSCSLEDRRRVIRTDCTCKTLATPISWQQLQRAARTSEEARHRS